MDFKNSETLKNLTRAFTAECVDGAKYQYIADTATQKKMSQISTILKALATNEMAHAKIFYDLINEKANNEVDIIEFKATLPVKSGNFEQMFDLKINEEDRQADIVYPAFAKTAEREGFDDISTIFKQIAKIESCHAVVLSELNQMIKNDSIYKSDSKNLWKCTNCGHEDELVKAWKKCPLCSMDQGYVKITLLGSPRNCCD